MSSDDIELNFLRKKFDTNESDTRDFLRTLPNIRTHNDKFFFDHNLLHKELAMIFLTKQQLNKDGEARVDKELDDMYGSTVDKFNAIV